MRRVAPVIASGDIDWDVMVCRRRRCGGAAGWVLALVLALVLGQWGSSIIALRRSCLSLVEGGLVSALLVLVAELGEEVVLALAVVSPWDPVDGNELRQSLEEHSQHPTQAWAGRLSPSGRP